MDLLDKMATYVRVIEAGSFSAAAKQLRLSSAAVSRQIATLERELRAPLLARSTRRMTITPAGREYYERCLQILRDVEDAQTVGRAGSTEGRLQVTAPVSFGLARVAPHVRALLSKHPGLNLDLRLEDRILDLALEGVDVAIRVGKAPLASTDIVAHELPGFRRILVASPAYLKRRGEPRTPEMLAKHEALTYPTGEQADVWALTDDLRETRVRVRVVFRCNALQVLREASLEGAGVALLPDFLVAADLKRGLRRVLPEWRTEPVAVNAVHRTVHRGAPRIRALVAHLRDAYRAAE